MSGEWNAELLDNKKEYVVIDDIPLYHKDINRSYKQLLGCQYDFSVTDKYLHKQHIVAWRKPCIYVSNMDPRKYKKVEGDWLDGNCIVVEIKRPLFIESDPPGTPGSSQSMLNQLVTEIEEDSEFGS